MRTLSAVFVCLLVCLAPSLSLASDSDADGGENIVEPIVLNTQNFDDQIKPSQRGGQRWLVEFYAPWCIHCQNFKPVYDRISTQLAGSVAVAKVDCPDNKALCDRFGIQSYPTLYLIDEATAKVHRYSDSKTEEAVLKFVRTDAWRKATSNDFPFPNGEAMQAFHDEGVAARVAAYISTYPFRSIILFVFTFVGITAGYLAFVAGDHGKPEENKLTL